MKSIDKLRDTVAGFFYRLAIYFDPTDWQDMEESQSEANFEDQSVFVKTLNSDPISLHREIKSIADRDMEEMTRGFGVTKEKK